MERAQHRYSDELKRAVVAEVEAGTLSVRDAARTAHTAVTQVQKWLDEFGRYRPKRDIVEVVMKSEQDRIAALEKALADAHLTMRVYDELITQANKHYKTDLKKSFGMAPSARVDAPGSPSAASARDSAAPATPTTNGSDGGPGARRDARPQPRRTP